MTAETLSLAQTHWGGDDSVLDLKVKVLYGSGGNDILSQYVKFTQVYKENRKLYGATQETVLRTIQQCVDNDILSAYLMARKGEVMDIMMTLFDMETVQENYGESLRAEGMAAGMAKGRLSTLAGLVKDGILTEEAAAKRANLSVAEFRKEAMRA